MDYHTYIWVVFAWGNVGKYISYIECLGMGQKTQPQPQLLTPLTPPVTPWHSHSEVQDL